MFAVWVQNTNQLFGAYHRYFRALDIADTWNSRSRDKAIVIELKLFDESKLPVVADEDRCEYTSDSGGQTIWRCPDIKHDDLRLCSYHDTVSSVRFDPKWKN